MFGRAALFLVLGFSVLFTVYTSNILFTTTKTVTFYATYYNQTKAQEVAQSGATMACNAFFLTQSATTQWSAGYSNVSYDGGTFNVGVSFPGGGIVQITSIGTYANTTDTTRDTIQIKLRPSNFAKFGNFYSTVGDVYFATGDTTSGPIHFNTTCNVTGTPVFLGKVTCLNGINKYGSANPKFLGGFQSGVSISLNNTATNLASGSGPSSGGVTLGGSGSKPYINVDMTFNSDGTVTYKTQTSSSSSFSGATWSATTTTALTTFAPNGVILIKQGNITTRGTVKGSVTIACVANGAGSNFGNVYIDNNLVYNTDPRTNASSTDMLGLVAENNIQLNYNSSFGDVNIMGSLLAQNGGLVIQNYGSYPSIHNLKLYGGLSANTLNATSDASITHGFRYNQTFDNRFYNQYPPYFPVTGTYEVISWLE